MTGRACRTLAAAMNSSLPLLLVGTTSAGKIRELRQLLADLPATGRLPCRPRHRHRPRRRRDLVRRQREAQSPRLPPRQRPDDAGRGLWLRGRRPRTASPGVISARWGGTDYTVKNQLILDRLAGLPGPAARLRLRHGTCHRDARRADLSAHRPGVGVGSPRRRPGPADSATTRSSTTQTSARRWPRWSPPRRTRSATGVAPCERRCRCSTPSWLSGSAPAPNDCRLWTSVQQVPWLLRQPPTLYSGACQHSTEPSGSPSSSR